MKRIPAIGKGRRVLVAPVVALCVLALAVTIPAGAQSGNTWRIDYYPNPDWSGSPTMTQYASFISFNWGYGSPGPAIPVDNFTAQMNTDAFFYAGTYQFQAVADDEIAVIVDGVTFLDTRNAGQSGKSFTFDVNMWQGTHHVLVLYREFTQTAYVSLTWVYTKPGPGPTPPPGPPPPPPNNCAPQSATSVQTRYGNYTPCIQNNSHQSNCFQSDGAWDSPNMGSIQMEPKIVIWGNCTADTTTHFPVSCDPQVPQQSYNCSKTEAGWFPN
jgi:hypothetical protein